MCLLPGLCKVIRLEERTEIFYTLQQRRRCSPTAFLSFSCAFSTKNHKWTTELFIKTQKVRLKARYKSTCSFPHSSCQCHLSSMLTFVAAASLLSTLGSFHLEYPLAWPWRIQRVYWHTWSSGKRELAPASSSLSGQQFPHMQLGNLIELGSHQRLGQQELRIQRILNDCVGSGMNSDVGLQGRFGSMPHLLGD